MPVFITRKIIIAFTKCRRPWKNVQNIRFIFTSECSRRNWALPPLGIITKNSPFHCIKRQSKDGAKFKSESMSRINNFDIWEEFDKFVVKRQACTNSLLDVKIANGLKIDQQKVCCNISLSCFFSRFCADKRQQFRFGSSGISKVFLSTKYFEQKKKQNFEIPRHFFVRGQPITLKFTRNKPIIFLVFQFLQNVLWKLQATKNCFQQLNDLQKILACQLS